ncbi:hypothetical protein ONT15_14060 [Prevotella copri]|uniref:hypothetical protein n=1 Tax=Segatella copri TaxID=165179 RepID=UPI002230B53F|nr:hypothetical protein [Segatella copri]MCW4100497.1 hypothetical protein [Segatella copri]
MMKAKIIDLNFDDCPLKEDINVSIGWITMELTLDIIAQTSMAITQRLRVPADNEIKTLDKLSIAFPPISLIEGKTKADLEQLPMVKKLILLPKFNSISSSNKSTSYSNR